MGHQFSKFENEDTSTSSNLPYLLHHPRNPFAQKAVLDNDGLSRTTEITDESMTPPPSPAVGKLRHRESWRRGATIPTYSSTALHLQVDGSHSVGQHYHHGLLPRRDSDPGKLRQPRTLPVKCPPSQRQIASGHDTPVNTAGGTASPKDGLEASYLERMYDSRTWEMYRRITEARKRARTIYVPSKVGVVSAAATVSAMDQRQGPTGFNPTAATTPSSEDTCEWEHLQQEEEPNGEESQHEMIFLFDF